MNRPILPSTRVGFLLAVAAAFIWGSFIRVTGQSDFGDERQSDFIEIRNPQKLPTKIPCSRIALGEKGDYKPCIAKLPNGELLIVAFDASHEKIDGGTPLAAYSYAGKDLYPTDLRIEVVRWKLPRSKSKRGEVPR